MADAKVEKHPGGYRILFSAEKDPGLATPFKRRAARGAQRLTAPFSLFIPGELV